MTDRVKGFRVLLEVDCREDDAETLRAVVANLKGVQEVSNDLATPEDWAAERRARQKLKDLLFRALDD